ncbi:ASCH domain-containing protein [Micromonospora sp. WMMD1128]|uniref:ASCH domain-containing protein n=1 Tax=unclassified Micromonospora TaxID=2617518 RepID=UPI00248C0D8F|nr:MULTISPECIES: ASCH domain-containing protein [unclassified Micromonospora]WBB76658.1 ASCH domain-containing protein [Micromonospora sp. WMMD1128]WFE35554.1 ASCH domain-containing protein [Micromonospora sp. WMMD975]
MTAAELPIAEFAFPGPLRDQLVAAVLDGTKTSTTGLLQDYEIDGEALPEVGARFAVVDSAGAPVAVIEVVEVRVARVGDVDLDHARDEGEGYESVADWRAGHERYWHGGDYRGWLGDPAFTVDDDTPAVLERFRLVETL